MRRIDDFSIRETRSGSTTVLSLRKTKPRERQRHSMSASFLIVSALVVAANFAHASHSDYYSSSGPEWDPRNYAHEDPGKYEKFEDDSDSGDCDQQDYRESARYSNAGRESFSRAKSIDISWNKRGAVQVNNTHLAGYVDRDISKRSFNLAVDFLQFHSDSDLQRMLNCHGKLCSINGQSIGYDSARGKKTAQIQEIAYLDDATKWYQRLGKESFGYFVVVHQIKVGKKKLHPGDIFKMVSMQKVKQGKLAKRATIEVLDARNPKLKGKQFNMNLDFKSRECPILQIKYISVHTDTGALYNRDLNQAQVDDLPQPNITVRFLVNKVGNKRQVYGFRYANSSEWSSLRSGPWFLKSNVSLEREKFSSTAYVRFDKLWGNYPLEAVEASKNHKSRFYRKKSNNCSLIMLERQSKKKSLQICIEQDQVRRDVDPEVAEFFHLDSIHNIRFKEGYWSFVYERAGDPRTYRLKCLKGTNRANNSDISKAFRKLEDESTNLADFLCAVGKNEARDALAFATIEKKRSRKRYSNPIKVALAYNHRKKHFRCLVDSGSHSAQRRKKRRRKLSATGLLVNPFMIMLISAICGVLVWALSTLSLTKTTTESHTSARSTLCSEDIESDSDPVIEGTLSRVASFLSRPSVQKAKQTPAASEDANEMV